MTLVEPTRPHPLPEDATAAPERAGRIETRGAGPHPEQLDRPAVPLGFGDVVDAACLLPGFLSVSGPAAGTPSEVITRAMYGVRGNRVYTAISGWIISVCYFALNPAAASVAAFALPERVGIEQNTLETVVVVVAIAAITFGHQRVRARHYRPAVPAVYTGPVAALTGVDLALPAGMVVAAAVYATMSRIGRPRTATVG